VSTGLLIVWFRPEDRAALLISVVLIGMGLAAIAVGMDQSRWRLAVITVHAVWAASSMPALYLFPDGRFVPRWTRWLTAIWLIYTVAWLIFPEISPPLGISQGFTGSELPRHLWYLLWISSGLVAQIHRYRKVSNEMERQQIKWVEFGFFSFVILYVIGVGIITLTQLAPMGAPTMVAKLAGSSIALLGTLTVPLSLGISILRYHLFDIDIIINRTLVYGALTTIIVAIYILIVGIVGTLMHAQGNLLITLLATGLIAVLFQPLREWLQRRVNRLIYGERDDPIEALSRLGKQMEVALPSDQVLPALVKTIAQSLKLPYVGITQKGRLDISFGQETDNPVSFPFTFQGETTGVLLAAPHSPGESFSSAEMRLLQNLARQAGVVVRNAQLTADLQRSRQTLVTAREEERHHLRRDLHDGIGPTMAGLTLKLDAAKDLVSSGLESGKKDELEAAVQLLSELKTQTQDTVQNIRHIVHTLRPPSLDVLGLIPALQAHFGQVVSPRTLDIQMTTTPHSSDFPRLSAAVEVAAYRIVLEAVTNVIQHAQAEKCEVSLALENGNLKMEIKDDGVGLPKARVHGIGLDSMRERAEELGGRFELSSSPQGTSVCAEIPASLARNES
jgi:signal transduction histidine kinase